MKISNSQCKSCMYLVKFWRGDNPGLLIVCRGWANAQLVNPRPAYVRGLNFKPMPKLNFYRRVQLHELRSPSVVTRSPLGRFEPAVVRLQTKWTYCVVGSSQRGSNQH